MQEIFFKVTVAGEDVSDLLESLQVDESDSRTNMAILIFGDSNLVFLDTLHEGLSVEIDLGGCDAHAVIFRGIITGVQGNFPARGQPQVTVNAMDSMIRLYFQPKEPRPPWQNVTVSQIVKQIAQDNGLVPGKIEPTVDELLQETRPLQQAARTDLNFLWTLAREYDAKLYVDHREAKDTLNFVSTQHLLEAEPLEVALIFNANLQDFSVSIDVFAVAAQLRLVTTDPLTGKPFELSEAPVKASETLKGPDPERIAGLGKGAERLSDLTAAAASERASLGDSLQQLRRELGASSRPASDRSGTLSDPTRQRGQRGEGRAAGSFWLRPYRRVKIEGCGGERWSGDDWYLAQVRHQVDIRRRSYITSFTCTR